ncbi:MAG: CapA family protein [Lishizhenia sp.]
MKYFYLLLLYLPLNSFAQKISIDSEIQTSNESQKVVSTESSEEIAKNTRVNIKIEDSTERTVTLVAVGDIMMGTNFPSERYLPPKEVNLLQPVEAILQNADVTFGNLEGTILNEGGELKKCSDSSKCYAFRQPEYLIEDIKNAGFDLLSLANNHVGDFGDTGKKNTTRILKEKGITFAGMDSCPWDTITINGITYGFSAFSPNRGTLQITDYEMAQAIVSKLDSISDIVVVSFHGGAEGATKTHVTRATEKFYGENRGNVYKFSRVVIDAGADVVLGHGPHVTRAIDVYKNRFIAYSMGNFCTYHRFNLRGVNGMAPIFKLNLTTNGELVAGEIISIKQEGEGGPVIDDKAGAFNEVKKLTATDIPELKIDFSENGTFKLRK